MESFLGLWFCRIQSIPITAYHRATLEATQNYPPPTARRNQGAVGSGKIIRFGVRVVPGTVLPCQTMNIIIEDAETLKFFTGDGRWTKNIAEGKRYAQTALAFKAAKQEPVGKFNIVGYIGETEQFINLDHGRGKGAVESPA